MIKEAMKLALEALEYIYEGANNQGPHTGISWRCVAVKAEPAITAIKQAVALDKMAENAKELGLDYEPCCKDQTCPKCKPAPVQQEPVIAQEGDTLEIETILYTTLPAQPVPVQVVDIAALVEGMEVSIDVSTGDHDSGNRLFGSVTMAQENQGSKHGLILLVQDPEANFKTITPPAAKRPWVGLTDKEYVHITDAVFHQGRGLVAYYLAIEAKLKEKNTAAQPVIPDAMTSADIQEHIEYVAGWNDCRAAMMEMMK